MDLHDISVVNGESQEIIHASGAIRHRTSYDSRRDRIGVSFDSKRFDKTVTGQVRLPRHRPAAQLSVAIKSDSAAVTGDVVDLNVRSVRVSVVELPALHFDGNTVFANGDVVSITVSTDSRALYTGAGTVTRMRPKTSEIVVELVEGILDMRDLTIAEKADFARSVIMEKEAVLEEFSDVRQDFKALVSDWSMYFGSIQTVLRDEEVKGFLYTADEERRYLEDLTPEVFDRLRRFIDHLNGIAPSIDDDHLQVHKRYLRSQLDQYIRQSPLACSIMDKLHGYNGDFETVKLFFSDPHIGSTMFGKLMNSFIVSLEPVQAHVNRIGVLHHEIANLAHDRDVRLLSLGAGPAEEVLRVVGDQSIQGRVSVTLVDVDSHALADFYERVQYVQNPNVEVELINLNVIDIIVGRETGIEDGAYDFAYCAGMYDYFKDRFCRKFTRFLMAKTRPGGSFMFTNVHARNFARYFMDFGGGWEIHHRTNDETRALAPEDVPCEVFTDVTGTNIFVRGTRLAGSADQALLN